MTAEAVIRFSLLSALSNANDTPEQASKPFAKNRGRLRHRRGLGGAGARGLRQRARARRHHPRVIRGAAEKSDDFHRTRSKPDGSAIIAALQNTFEDAGIAPDAIDYINAHGTGTPENDKMEAMSLEKVFGERLRGVPISSNKSMLGHTLTSSGAIEAVLTIKTIQSGVHPADHQLPGRRSGHHARRGAQPRARAEGDHGALQLLRLRRQNACLIIAAEPA